MSLQLCQTYSPLHSTYQANGQYVDIVGDESGWHAFEVSPDGFAGIEIAQGGSMEAVLSAVELVFGC